MGFALGDEDPDVAKARICGDAPVLAIALSVPPALGDFGNFGSGFEDNSVDEVHGYHIIEHFYRDEVPGILKEWTRVLKKGGVLVLEQPDVVKCAANFLSGLVNGNKQLEYNLGFLGIYGDGTSKAPLMGHKWGWYPETLGEALVNVGLVNVRQEPAKMHMKDVRDFRIIGEKE